MRSSPVDVLLHPVRLRIVRALRLGREATVGDIADALPDVPPAILYRHVNKLASAGLIEAVSERAVRGATERRYRLVRAALSDADISAATPEEHLHYFITFVATLIDDCSAYLERGFPNYARDGVGYRQAPLNLSDAEFRRLTKELSGVLAPFAALAPSPKRKLRFFSTIVMPAEPRRAR